MYREMAAELVHAHFVLPDGFAAARFAAREDVPLVLTMWGTDVLVYGGRPSLRPMLKRTFEVARAIIAVSDELADRAQQIGARPDRLRVIPGGVHYPQPVARSEARAVVGLPDAATCLLWVGGFVPIKQPLHAVEAFEELAERTEGAFLVMIGDGPLRRDVDDYVRRRNLNAAVLRLGYLGREHVWTWQCAADVLVNSSRSEGTPLSVLEALGAGARVVGYPVGGVGAAVDAVAGGRLAAEKTPRALAAAIADELAFARDRQELAGHARNRFDIARTGREIEEVYDQFV
jgi:teichuronic acid biosynthesis glycosyltransferase TuaC